MTHETITVQIKQKSIKLQGLQDEHQAVRPPTNYWPGPMDDTTPWSKTGEEMMVLREEISELTSKLTQ
ncbi:MAG TPA: hypothetical protein VL401_04240 [Alphaproteobacteria bacterium]|jgi:hypothetical protein|nr:hypothetical protein [Alphaproteobacteria bacterium]